MRRSLALLVAATMSLVLIAFLVPLGLLIRWGTAERAVSAASSQASTLGPVIAAADRQSEAVALSLAAVGAETGRAFTVFYPDGTTEGTPGERTPAVELAAVRVASLSADADGGLEVLVAVGLPDGTAVIRTFVTDDELTSGVARTWLILAGLGVVLVTLGVGVADRMARPVVRPLVDASRVADRLAAGDLDARVEPGGPAEVRGVANGLNHLAGRITGMLREEREGVADLSHRLRTPLTALRLDAEALPEPGGQRISADVDALERAVTQAIRDARSRGAGVDAGVACDAAQVVADRVAFWSVLAEDTDRRLDSSLAAGPFPVRVSADALTECVDALLGNVFAHTPDGTPVEVRLEPGAAGGARLIVADAGPGFPGSFVVERGTSPRASTGLGLDIARSTAEASGGSLSIGRSALGGAQVTIALGPATP